MHSATTPSATAFGRSTERLVTAPRPGVDDVAGIGVHIGARVSTLAGPGEVLVTSAVKDLVIGSDLGFRDRGARTLKGVPGDWHHWTLN